MVASPCSVIEMKGRIAESVREAVSAAQKAGDLPKVETPAFIVEVPGHKEHGDLATNVAMLLAKAAKLPPRQIAEAIAAHFDAGAADVERVEVAGPGFINFRVTTEWLHKVVRSVHGAGERYGQTAIGGGTRVQIEFVSANPTGPMNVVNARAAAVGDCLASLMQASGFDVTRECYVNDAGNQVDVFARSLAARLAEELGEPAEFPDDGYPGEYVRELARGFLASDPQLADMEAADRMAFFREHGIDRMLDIQRGALARFGVTFDVWYREHVLHDEGKVAATVERLEDRGHMYERDGARWFRASEFGDDKDRVVVKNDGTLTYLAADIAYHDGKFERGFRHVIDILGPDHHGYVARMKAAVNALGYDPDRLEILILQLITLLRGGRPVRMSKRAGEFITMDELVEEVGRDAARYFFLMRSPESPLEFDIDLAKEQSSDNPVYYVQYAHARICSLFRQAEEAGRSPLPDPQTMALGVLQEEAELDLIRKLAQFPEQVQQAALRREPQRVAHYAHELATLFHAFYTRCRVLGEPSDVERARLALAGAARIVLKNALTLLGVSAPEEM